MSVCEIKRLGDVDFMFVSRLFLVLLILSAFAAPVFVSEGFAVDGQDVAALAVDRAEESVVLAYDAVLDAEESGANVSGLLVRLNIAGEYLASARVWFGLGDFVNATRFADLCFDVGEEVRSEAVELENEAYGLWVTSLFVRMTVSIFGVFFVVFLGFLVWRWFKRCYRRRVLGFRPEVAKGES